MTKRLMIRRMAILGAQSCGCGACTRQVWFTIADSFTCGARVNWVFQQGSTVADACSQVAGEFPQCEPCGCSTLAPSPEPSLVGGLPDGAMARSGAPSRSPLCGCDTCTDTVLMTLAGGFMCGARINLAIQQGNDIATACSLIAGQFQQSAVRAVAILACLLSRVHIRRSLIRLRAAVTPVPTQFGLLLQMVSRVALESIG